MKPRVVFDTMVFLQAASQPGRVHRTMRAVRDHEVELCVSHALLAEIQDVLTRRELRAKFPAMTPEVVDEFLLEIAAQSTLLPAVPAAFTWAEHPDDDHVLDLCVASGALALVTWETRMLELIDSNSQSGAMLRALAPRLVAITPAQFGEWLVRQSP